MKDGNIISGNASNHAHCDEIDEIPGTWAASCQPVVVKGSGGAGSSAADAYVPAFEEHASKMEA